MDAGLVSDGGHGGPKLFALGCPPGKIEMRQLGEPRLGIGGAEARQPLEWTALYRIKGSERSSMRGRLQKE